MARCISAQRCAQCDYLPFFLAGRSLRGHHRLILSNSFTHTRTHPQTQVRLCHFNDSIASGTLPSIVLSDPVKAYVASACPTSLNLTTMEWEPAPRSPLSVNQEVVLLGCGTLLLFAYAAEKQTGIYLVRGFS